METTRSKSTENTFERYCQVEWDSIATQANKISQFYFLSVFLLGLIISPVFNTWEYALGMGSLSLILYIVSVHIIGGGFLSRLMLAGTGNLLGIQLFWQMPGLMAIQGIVLLNGLIFLLYYDWRLIILSNLFLVLHHTVVLFLMQRGQEGLRVYFALGHDPSVSDGVYLAVYFGLIFIITATGAYLAYLLEVKFREKLLGTFETKEQLGLMEKGIAFAQQISKGDLDVDYQITHEKEQLGKALIEMRDNLQKAASKESQENYINVGIAQLSKLLQNNLDQLQVMTDSALKEIVSYLGVHLGGILILEEEEDAKYLTLLASYAYGRKKYIQGKQLVSRLSSDLTVQVYLEKKEIVLKEIPQDYIQIASAMGEASPNFIFIIPLTLNEEVVGVLELGSFAEIEEYQQEYVRRASENLAAAITNSKNVQTQELLEQTQIQAEKLKAIEEELRQNLEEMSATQEEMKRKEIELKGQLSALNRTMATIEFDLQGKILLANDIFLQTMKYELSDIAQQHHRIFVDANYASSQEYQNFWYELRQGKAQTAEFKRFAQDGSEVWLQATYTPVFDSFNKPFKIIKLATDVTEQKKQSIYHKGQIQALRRSNAVVEFSPEGIIRDANFIFLDLMEYVRDEVIGQHHQMFVEASYRNSEEYKAFWNKLQTGQYLKGEFKRLTKTGQEVWIQGSYNPIFDLENRLLSIVKIVQDITLQKNLELKNSQIIQHLKSQGHSFESLN